VAPSAGGGRAAHATTDELLDAFAARTAHTLGAGVGVAGGYASLLREQHAGQLDAEGIEALGALEGGLGRLRLVVEDLLELSGLAARELRVGPVDTAAAVAAATAGLRAPLRAARVELEVGALPALVGDPALVERLFHHLIRGAVAAIGRGPGVVAVTGRRHGAEVHLEVADDGAPLGPDGAEGLFAPVATPRGGGPLVGAGVSMAICRRIAERHGGSVSARAGERAGATVVVVLAGAA
jgi:chemotaxis family two-component system sensor kinase Cph1